MYSCTNCGCIFEEPSYEDISYEEYCGVDDLFPKSSHHYFTIERCPNCGSGDFEEVYEDDEE